MGQAEQKYQQYPPVGAKSAVTDGTPEDINQMPPTFLPDLEGPVYDGSDLARGEACEKAPREKGSVR